jgi:site-specific recombinase XerD
MPFSVRDVDFPSFFRPQNITLAADRVAPNRAKWFLRQVGWTVKAPQARRSYQEKVKNFLKYCFESEMISKNPAMKWKGVKVKLSDQNIRAFEPSEYEKILSGISATKMTDANKRRIRALMQLQRWSGLSLVDAVCLSKDELKQEGKGKNESFRVVTDRQKTGTLINNWIPAWLGQGTVDRQERQS